jgi:uroporphyrinogen-III synthase
LPEPAGVLITRPEPGASETASRVAALGFRPVVAPVLTVTPRALRYPAGVQAILVTSGNAIPSLHAACRTLPLFAVGDATAERAGAAGFTRIESAGRDAAALIALAIGRCDPAGAPLFLAAGAGQGQALAATLRSRGFRVVRRVAYTTRPATRLAAAIRGGFGGVDAALFFSSESARIFVHLLQDALPRGAVAAVTAVAISPPTAAALAPLPWRSIRVASRPNQDELLALLR